MDKRVLIVNSKDRLNGAELYLKTVADYFINKGFMVDVFFIKKRKTGSWDEIENDRVRLFYSNSSKERFGIPILIKNLIVSAEGEYEYVFTSHVHLNSIVGIMRRFKLIKTRYHIGRESTSIFTRFRGIHLLKYKLYYIVGYSGIDLLVCQTDFMKEQLLTAIGNKLSGTNVQVIPNPVSIPKRNYEKINLPYSNFIVAAGRLIEEKGFDILINAFLNLKRDFSDINLVILGEGKLRVELENLIERVGLQYRVFLPGFVNDVYKYFYHARLCVVSSRVEGFPNVLLQMMSQNEKVVSTLCAGGINTLKGIETVQPNDAQRLCDAMTRVLERDNIGNRELFDIELEERGIDRFIQKIMYFLKA